MCCCALAHPCQLHGQLLLRRPRLLPLRSVIVLEDNDVLHIVGGSYGIYNTSQADVEAAVPRRLQVLQLEVEQIMKVRPREGGTCRACGSPPAAAARQRRSSVLACMCRCGSCC